MDAFTLYLLKSAICLAGFALVYLLFLRNERFFLLKRVFLVSGILISFFFPLIPVHYAVMLPAQFTNPADIIPVGNPAFIAIQKVSPDKPFDYRYIFLFLYLSGALFIAYRSISFIWSIIRTIKKANINYRGKAKLIRASEFTFSFSFFNYVFVNPSVNETEVEQIMNHELVHVHQKHWFDLLLIELLRLFQWVNPFVWIYTRFIRVNHEYIADRAALQRTSDPAIYKAVLLNQMFRSPVFSLSSSFCDSLNKKRFEMMKKIITSPYRKLKILFVLPVIAILLFAFATPEYHYRAAAGNTISILQPQAKDGKEVKGIVVNEEGSPVKGATVIISGNPAEVLTDASGHFTIGNVAEDAHLIISSKGCVSQYLEPAFSSEMKVKMLLDKGSLLSLLVRASYKNGPYPIVILNGVEIHNGINEIDENEIISIGGGFPEKNGTAFLGEKGKNGVLFITTKKKAEEPVENKPGEINAATQQIPSAPSEKVSKVVKGTVVQEDGKPLPGVTIEVNEASKGVISDSTGHFVIGNVPEDASLVFSLAGYKTQKLTAEFRNRFLTGDMVIKLYKNNTDNDFGIYNKGQVAIRGSSSWTSQTKPLIIIDGVESNTDLEMFDPNEINSISILKDKSATAVYGNRGSNGVIIVTTKRKTAGSVENKPPEAPVAAQQTPSVTSAIVKKVVKGTVVKEDGKPLQGVFVNVSTELVRSVSDEEGHFRIENVPENAYLVFSHKDYKPLILKAVFISEMTVKFPNDPDGTEQVLIREPVTIISFSSRISRDKPLVIIDGVESNTGMEEIDPNDIKSISVFKDKSATAVYGDKGINGVIIITKKAKVIKGTVVQEDGKPLQGATILSSGPMGDYETISDAEGWFLLTGIPADVSLLIRCKGFRNLVVKPPFSTEMTVKMEPDNENPGENQPAKAAPSGDEKERISGVTPRGRNITYIIDGVPAGINDMPLDPNEIESVTVIKDIVGKPISGPVGAEGIVFIKTKNAATSEKKKPESK